jgi:hypothetical protein
MLSRVAVLAIVLLLLSVAAPGVEAIAGCLEACPDEAPQQRTCSDEVCCSCCVHAGPLFAALPLPAPPVDCVGVALHPDGPSVPTDEPSGILHVPKPSAS